MFWRKIKFRISMKFFYKLGQVLFVFLVKSMLLLQKIMRIRNPFVSSVPNFYHFFFKLGKAFFVFICYCFLVKPMLFVQMVVRIRNSFVIFREFMKPELLRWNSYFKVYKYTYIFFFFWFQVSLCYKRSTDFGWQAWNAPKYDIGQFWGCISWHSKTYSLCLLETNPWLQSKRTQL